MLSVQTTFIDTFCSSQRERKKKRVEQTKSYALQSHIHVMTAIATPLKKNIYFARHGERIDFIDKTWIESAERRLDPPLSSYGLHQAHELGVYIANLQPRITHIYASPFLRTIQTALQVVRQINKNISSTDEITKIRLEPGYGEYNLNDIQWTEQSLYRPSHELSEISQDSEYFDQDYDSVIKADYYLQTKVETLQQLRDRLKRVVQHTLDAHTFDCNILIITHAATLIESVRALLTITAKRNQDVIKKEEVEITTYTSTWDMSPIRAGVCSLTHLQIIDDTWTLSKNGLISYLSNGEQYAWFFPDDEALYKASE